MPACLRLAAAGCATDTIEGAEHFLHIERPSEVRDRIQDRRAR